MSIINNDITVTQKVSNSLFTTDGIYSKQFRYTRRVEFILYNIPSKTGVMANSPYTSLLNKLTIEHCEHYYKGQYKISKFREDHIKIPDEGYSTKVFIKTVFVTTTSKVPDEKKYFNSLDF